MTVDELIERLSAIPPEKRALPVVFVDVDYGATDPDPVVEEAHGLGAEAYGDQWVRL